MKRSSKALLHDAHIFMGQICNKVNKLQLFSWSILKYPVRVGSYDNRKTKSYKRTL
jgi:hypothetical protein